MRCAERLRSRYRRRSSASCTITFWPRPMKSWRMTGSESRTSGDIGMSASTGTSRQPSTTRPSSRTVRSSSFSQAAREAGSRGRKIMPTPYSPAGGSVTPWAAISSRSSASGICSSIPAPSPNSVSAPVAPRWSRLSRMRSPYCTISWLLRPLICATKPTPQASCSLTGLYIPCGAGSARGWNIGMGSLLVPQAPARAPCQDFPGHATDARIRMSNPAAQ